jgi:hypothetical protein
VDCVCSTTGTYLAPALPKRPAVVAQSGTLGNSPNGVYKVQITPAGGSTTIEVTEINSGALLLTQSVTGTSLEYGFSPDDARFAYSVTNGGNRIVRVFDLSNPGTPPRIDRSSSASQVFGGFSPSGKYFVYAQAPGGTGFVEIFDAKTGTLVFQSSGFSFSQPAGAMGSQFPPLVWGFSPDAGDRTFTYWYWATPGTAQWTAVNLATPRVVLSMGLTGVSLGRFSPCGDVLALVTQASGSSVVNLYRTRDGNAVGSPQTFSSTAAPTLQCTATGHNVSFGGQPTILAVNRAGDPHC